MKRLFFFLLLAYPLLSFAQHDDIYFVPKKEKKDDVSVTKTENLVLFEDEDEWCDEDAYYTDDYGYENDEFRYSTRIVRFRSPRSVVSSSLYWDLTYNCGINDWMVYDDGYYLDIYPTYSNSLYYWSRPSYNWWVWDSWYYRGYNWGYNYWGHHNRFLYPSYHWNGPHFSGTHFGPHIAHNSWRPAHKVHRNVPVNGGNRVNVATRPGNNNPRGKNGAARVERGSSRVTNAQSVQASKRASTGSANSAAGSVRRSDDLRSSAPPRQQQRGVTNNVRPVRSSSGVRTQQQRTPSNSNVSEKKGSNKGTTVGARTDSGRSSSTSSSSRSSNRGSYRTNSSSSSSGEYNRPSSTSVSRQRNTSSGGHSSAGSLRSSGSSRSSSGAARSGSRR